MFSKASYLLSQESDSDEHDGLIFLCDALDLSCGDRETISRKMLDYFMTGTIRDKMMHFSQLNFYI